MIWTDFLLVPMSFRTERILILKYHFGLSKAQTSESTGRLIFSLFSWFSSARQCLQISLSCDSEPTDSSTLFSTTTSQLTGFIDLLFQLVVPVHLPSVIGQRVSLLRSLALLIAWTSMRAAQPERTAQSHEATHNADQRRALCPCSDASWENGTL